MNDNTHDIDRLLKARFIDEPSANLADRIIHQASLNTSYNASPPSYWKRFKKLFPIIHYPALASIAFVAIGLYFGMFIDNESSNSLEHLNDWLSFTSLSDEDFL